MSSTTRITALASHDAKEAFGAYALQDLNRWREVVGQCILHRLYDVGMIIDLQKSPTFNEDCLYIEFASETRHFKIAKFGADPYVLELTLSHETIGRIQDELRACREELAREEAEQARQTALWAEEEQRVERERHERERQAAIRVEEERRVERQRREQARQAAIQASEERYERERQAQAPYVAPQANVQVRINREERVSQRTEHRKATIQRQCQERCIRALMHFTRVDNLPSILAHGLLPRDTLERGPFPTAVFNDHERLDNCHDAVCLSIGFPNYKMFYPLHKDSPHDWVVLEIDPRVLWEKDCAFCCENAASDAVRTIPIVDRKTATAFAHLFTDFQRGEQSIVRSHLGIS
ncbi:MAG: hypothetical protein CYG59_05010, partial [Chloroflexi bacterium]